MTVIPAVFSDWAVDNLHLVNWATETVHISIMERAPVFPDMYEDDYVGSSAAHWSVHQTLDELLASPGWQSADATNSHANQGTSAASGLSVITDSGTTQIGAGFSFTYVSDAPIFARAFALTDDSGNIICTFAPSDPIYMAGTGDAPTYIQPNTESGENFLFSFRTETIGGSTSNTPVIGPVSLAIPSLKWEGARAAHVWLAPQRINFVANPSFEALGDDGKPFGWRANDTMNRVSGGVVHPPREKCVKVSGSEPVKILESLLFPAYSLAEYWSVEASISGTGRARIGIVFYPDDANPDAVAYLHGEWHQVHNNYVSGDISQDNFTTIREVIGAPETLSEGLLRIEFEGDSAADSVWVDNALADPNEAQLGYFDGGWDMGQLEDYSWYNGTAGQDVNAPHKTFSVFYNNKRSLASYLFRVSSGEAPRNAAISWVPEGSSVIPHWNDLYGVRTHSWREDIIIPTIDYVDKTVVTAL